MIYQIIEKRTPGRRDLFVGSGPEVGIITRGNVYPYAAPVTGGTVIASRETAPYPDIPKDVAGDQHATWSEKFGWHKPTWGGCGYNLGGGR